MRAVFFPAGDKRRASSRYRVYNIVPQREEFLLGKGGNWKDADVVVFQRTLGSRYEGQAKRMRQAGKLVVFDCSDFYFHKRWGNMSQVKRMARHAHFMTTSNGDDKHSIERQLKKRCHVVPNAQPLSSHRRKHANVATPSIVWIGRVGNMGNLEVVWPALQKLASERVPFQVVLINDDGSIGGRTLRLPRGHKVTGKKWSLDKIHRMVAQCDLGINPKAKQADGRYHKDQNISVLVWGCGIPCVTFDITKNWYGDIRRFLLDWKLRGAQGYKGIERAKRWEPSKVAGDWMKVFEKEAKRR